MKFRGKNELENKKNSFWMNILEMDFWRTCGSYKQKTLSNHMTETVIFSNFTSGANLTQNDTLYTFIWSIILKISAIDINIAWKSVYFWHFHQWFLQGKSASYLIYSWNNQFTNFQFSIVTSLSSISEPALLEVGVDSESINLTSIIRYRHSCTRRL